MSNFNMKFIKEAINVYGLQNCQAVPNTQGNTCTKLLVNGEVYKTGTLNKQACYDLVKRLADKQQNPEKYTDVEEITTGKNQVQFTKDFSNVYINGKKYAVWDIVKDIKPSRLNSEYLYKQDTTQHQKEMAYIIKTWLSNGNNYAMYLLYNLNELDFDLTPEEIAERNQIIGSIDVTKL